MELPNTYHISGFCNAARVLHIKVPAFADKFMFEWHPDKQAVYVIRLGVPPLFGDPIADDGMVKDHGTAINVVNIWLRGYKAHMMENSLGTEQAARRQREALGQRTAQGAGPAFERRDFEG